MKLSFTLAYSSNKTLAAIFVTTAQAYDALSTWLLVEKPLYKIIVPSLNFLPKQLFLHF